jgi:hypothetical protein
MHVLVVLEQLGAWRSRHLRPLLACECEIKEDIPACAPLIVVISRLHSFTCETDRTSTQHSPRGMADDYEDIEQLYLYANRAIVEDGVDNLQVPPIFSQIRFPLRDLVDEVANLLREGYVEPKYSNDEELAPLHPVNPNVLHHYWFGPTDNGNRAFSADW